MKRAKRRAGGKHGNQRARGRATGRLLLSFVTPDRALHHPPIIALAVVAVFCACAALPPQPERTRFVMLTPVASESSSKEGAGSRSNLPPLTVGLGPVQLPQYLDRPELVIRTSPNSIDLSDSYRWAEPLAESFRRVLAGDLTALLATSNIVQYPWESGTRLDYTIRLQVQRLDADLNDTAELAVEWELRARKREQVLTTRESQLDHTANWQKGDAVAAALSDDIAELGHQIASAIIGAEQQRLAVGASAHRQGAGGQANHLTATRQKRLTAEQ